MKMHNSVATWTLASGITFLKLFQLELIIGTIDSGRINSRSQIASSVGFQSLRLVPMDLEFRMQGYAFGTSAYCDELPDGPWQWYRIVQPSRQDFMLRSKPQAPNSKHSANKTRFTVAPLTRGTVKCYAANISSVVPSVASVMSMTRDT
jgi:hypothetical protein